MNYKLFKYMDCNSNSSTAHNSSGQDKPQDVQYASFFTKIDYWEKYIYVVKNRTYLHKLPVLV
jgi:hypothetical protein